MAFRPCIDLKNGKVVQIVGGTLQCDGDATMNFVAERPAREFAELYRQENLLGGHVIMLGPGNERAALECLAAYPFGLQLGGGITRDNARYYLDAGASHVIVTSALFSGDEFIWEKLEDLTEVIGRERLVVDVSCRRGVDGKYRVATNRWRTVTSLELSRAVLGRIESHCGELLVHAADVEGLCRGIDEELVGLLGSWVSVPTTYAGGANKLSDIELVRQLSGGKIDLTIGSALDIFGGSTVRFADAARQGVIGSNDATDN